MTNDTQRSTHAKVRDAQLPVSVPAMAEAFEAVRVSVERFSLLAGIAALQGMMAEEVAAPCRLAHWHGREHKAYRWGTTVGDLGDHGGKVKVRRPRVRDLGRREERLASGEAAREGHLLRSIDVNH